MKIKEKTKKYMKLLLLVFALGAVIALAYKFGSMHSFFTTVTIFAGSELVCNESASMNEDTKYIDGVCHFNYNETYCMGIDGIPTVKVCQSYPYTFKEKLLARVMTGRKMITGLNTISLPKEPMVLIE